MIRSMSVVPDESCHNWNEQHVQISKERKKVEAVNTMNEWGRSYMMEPPNCVKSEVIKDIASKYNQGLHIILTQLHFLLPHCKPRLFKGTLSWPLLSFLFHPTY